jgi:hypothetical protein
MTTTAATTLAEDCEAWAELKAEAERLDKLADEAKAAASKAELALFERMEHERVKSIKVGSTNFVTAETTYGQIQDRSEFVKWAEENMGELIEIKERKGLVNELVRERLDSGEVLPPGVGFYTRQYVSRRAS